MMDGGKTLTLPLPVASTSFVLLVQTLRRHGAINRHQVAPPGVEECGGSDMLPAAPFQAPLRLADHVPLVC